MGGPRVNTADRFAWIPARALLGRSWKAANSLFGEPASKCVQFQRDTVDCPGVVRGQVTARFDRTDLQVPLGAPIPVACPEEAAPAEFTLFALPSRADWGASRHGASLTARMEADGIRLALSGQGKVRAPKDFGTAWFVALDGKGEVTAHGPLDGGSADPRAYKEDDLVILSAETPLSRVFPLPKGLPGDCRRLLIGALLVTDEGGLIEEAFSLTAAPLDMDMKTPSAPRRVVAPDPGAPHPPGQ